MKTYIYIHICCINNWKTILEDLLFKVRDSGLYEKVDEIRCCLLGEFTANFLSTMGEVDSNIFHDPKIRIMKTSSHIKTHEKFTLDVLHDDAQHEDFLVLYFHSKGVSDQYTTNLEKAANVRDWVNYMCHFLIYKHEKCMELLMANSDTVGVNLKIIHKLHYSGNFWWSKASYIRKLEKCGTESYNSPEFWLTEKWIGVYENLWDTEINHYEQRYPSSEYS